MAFLDGGESSLAFRQHVWDIGAASSPDPP
jgi:hypothetical protein